LHDMTSNQASPADHKNVHRVMSPSLQEHTQQSITLHPGTGVAPIRSPMFSELLEAREDARRIAPGPSKGYPTIPTSQTRQALCVFTQDGGPRGVPRPHL